MDIRISDFNISLRKDKEKHNRVTARIKLQIDTTQNSFCSEDNRNYSNTYEMNFKSLTLATKKC